MNEEAVRAQLGRILASPQFEHSERLSRFLRLVVESAQKGDALKEYRIGVEVFDRGRDFDPRTDPIVRVQAAKLRSKLLEYYSSGGASDPLVISVPKGAYAADIRTAAGSKPAAPVAPGPPAAGDARSRVAVLPFMSMSSDTADEHFSDGLTEELINRLAQVPTLQVVARTSAFRFKNRAEDVREVGAALNVGAVVEGSVRRAAEQVRVTAQLIDVATGYHLFSRTYQREFSDLFALQDELAQAVANEITGGNASTPRVRKTKAPDLAAYVVYQRGMLALRHAFGGFGPAEQLFREALALDSTYAAAWGGLAHAYWLMTWYREMPAVKAMPLCRQAAEKTLELEPDAAEGHCSLGIVASGFEWHWHEAETHFERAIELQPSLAIIYPFYAVVCLLPQRKLTKACAMIERSLALDPFNPLFLAIGALIYACAGRYDQVHRLHRLGQDLNAAMPPTLPVEAFTQELEGNLDAAIEAFGGLAQHRAEMVSFHGHALAAAGRRDEARQCVERLARMPGPPALEIARVHVGLREADEALRWLAAAVAQRAVHLIIMPADPRFDWLREDARYGDVTRPMALR
jgi:TolB-like protein/tetratricopeptide (TPR) repeat protein